jgi:hypothetical protein
MFIWIEVRTTPALGSSLATAASAAKVEAVHSSSAAAVQRQQKHRAGRCLCKSGVA